jgi:hypothetical protein
MTDPIEGQLNADERRLLTEAILKAKTPPRVVVEVGTWLGGGSTLHILRALEQNGAGKLWGVEADRSIYERMIASIRAAVPESAQRFTPLFGFSEEVLPKWLAEQPSGFRVDLAFLDGGNRPSEQICEFKLLDPFIPVGGQLMGHDAKLRKGKWLVPYVSALDNWEAQLHDVSVEGLFYARKVAERPSPTSLAEAEARLRRLRRQPSELAAVILPQPVRKLMLRLLPLRLVRSLAEGRN